MNSSSDNFFSFLTGFEDGYRKLSFDTLLKHEKTVAEATGVDEDGFTELFVVEHKTFGQRVAEEKALRSALKTPEEKLTFNEKVLLEKKRRAEERKKQELAVTYEQKQKEVRERKLEFEQAVESMYVEAQFELMDDRARKLEYEKLEREYRELERARNELKDAQERKELEDLCARYRNLTRK